jgi:hypothetical protein
MNTNQTTLSRSSNHRKPGARVIPAAPSPPPVHLEYCDGDARKVCIAGSFNDWRPDATEMVPLCNGKWAKDLTLPPGPHEYRLVVDGKWMADAKASQSVPNPFGEVNSVLTVPAPA